MSRLLTGDLKKQSDRCRQAQCVLGGALFLATLAVYLVQIRPAVLQLAEVHRQYQAACVSLQQDQVETAKLPQVELEIERLHQRVERFDKKLSKPRDLAPFISDIQRISQESSLKMLYSQSDTKPRRTDQFSELPIKLTFEGDFQNGVVEFLRKTEDMQRLTRIQKLDIRSSEAHDGQVKAELTMNIYFAEE